jgi:hypothetical protein
MKVISTPTIREICKKCGSTIEMRPDELRVVGHDWDDPDPDSGKSYWFCPVCKTRNFIVPSSDLD